MGPSPRYSSRRGESTHSNTWRWTSLRSNQAKLTGTFWWWSALLQAGWKHIPLTQKAAEVSRTLAKEIIPWFGVPSSIGSDNGPAFVSQVIKGMSLAVGLTWDLHTQYHRRSSGRVERINRTIKTALAKQCQETVLPWPYVLPLALFKIRCTPRK
jgi:hypothetical protein